MTLRFSGVSLAPLTTYPASGKNMVLPLAVTHEHADMARTLLEGDPNSADPIQYIVLTVGGDTFESPPDQLQVAYPNRNNLLTQRVPVDTLEKRELVRQILSDWKGALYGFVQKLNYEHDFTQQKQAIAAFMSLRPILQASDKVTTTLFPDEWWEPLEQSPLVSQYLTELNIKAS